MTGPLAEVDLAILLPFACGSLIAVCSTVIIAGHLPLRMGFGFGGIWQAGTALGAIGATAVLVIVLCLSAPLLPTAVAVIAAGIAILAGPLLAQLIPLRLRDTQIGPIAAIVVSLATMFLLPRPF